LFRGKTVIDGDRTLCLRESIACKQPVTGTAAPQIASGCKNQKLPESCCDCGVEDE